MLSDRGGRSYKETILAAAKEIAVSRGISKVDMRSVASASGIALGTVYNYFPSKGDLLAEIIEDFWEGAFATVDWSRLECHSFYDNLATIYRLLYQYFRRFKENWLDQLALLDAQERSLGRQKQDEYYGRIRCRIVALMEMDSDLRSDRGWTALATKERLAEFILENMLTSLRKGEQDISFLIAVLRHVRST